MALLLQSGDYLRKQDGAKLLTQGDPGAVFHVLAPSWRTADFGNGLTAVSWPAPLDPSELLEFTVNCGTELNGVNSRISTVQVTLSGLAIAAGLEIYGTTNDLTNVTIWFSVDPAERVKANWNPPGEVHLVTVTVTAMSGQIFERTVSLTIRQK